MKYSTVFLLIFVLSCGIINAQNNKLKYIPEIKNMHKVDNGIYRSSQPNKFQLSDLEKAGFTEVLNLRKYHSDESAMKDTNLKLHRVKMSAHKINEKQLVEALQIIKNRKGPILIHCQHGSDRTGAVIAMYRIVFQGWTKEKAIEEMKNGGYGFHKIYSNIPKLIQKIDIESFKQKINQ